MANGACGVTPQPMVGLPSVMGARGGGSGSSERSWWCSVMDSALRPYSNQLNTCTCVRVSVECGGGGGVPWRGLVGDGRQPWRLGGAGLTWVAQHRDLSYQLAMENGRGGAWGLIGHSNRPGTQQRRRRERATLMALVNSQVGEKEGETGCSRPRRR